MKSDIEVLNSECFCISLDTEALRQAFESEIGEPGLSDLVAERCPNLFAARPVFVSDAHAARMARVVEAVESVVALPAYRQEVLAGAPAIARHDPGGPLGVFFGYDFHVAGDSFGLIEINTNAGGALLNAILSRAQHKCCPAVQAWAPERVTADALEADIVRMFQREWALAGHHRPLQSIAIVDEAPQQQYLYPEFLLFQRLFRRHGLQAVIADPSEFTLRGGVLRHGELAIDLVYNRLTDFSLSAPASAALREAYLEHAAVLTPHPQAHALYADKRNLALLSDAGALQRFGASAAAQEVLLAGIPHTEVVHPDNAERLWRERRHLFFKPFAGFGSRAAYRGDKLTQRVWQEILAGDYVAQALVAPGSRVVSNDEPGRPLKFDLRSYVYAGESQWIAARLYQGQTTNFRTPGGGFAPVYQVPADVRSECCGGVEHETRLFLLGQDGGVLALARERYVALVRGEQGAPEFAGRSFMLVDWYLRLADGRPQAVVNETCSWLVFDANGLPDLAAGLAMQGKPEPGEEQWRQLRATVFGEAARVCR
jgi:hypothetical protein